MNQSQGLSGILVTVNDLDTSISHRSYVNSLAIEDNAPVPEPVTAAWGCAALAGSVPRRDRRPAL